MGHATAAGFAEAVADGSIDLDAALHYHLTANHYPPIPGSMVPVARAAIDAFADDDLGCRIELPEGVTFRGARHATAHAVVEAMNLHAFLDLDED